MDHELSIGWWVGPKGYRIADGTMHIIIPKKKKNQSYKNLTKVASEIQCWVMS